MIDIAKATGVDFCVERGGKMYTFKRLKIRKLIELSSAWRAKRREQIRIDAQERKIGDIETVGLLKHFDDQSGDIGWCIDYALSIDGIDDVIKAVSEYEVDDLPFDFAELRRILIEICSLPTGGGDEDADPKPTSPSGETG